MGLLVKDLAKIAREGLALGMMLIARKIAFAACRLANRKPVVIFVK